MTIDVYCDESYPDLFNSTNPKARYIVIGSLWLKQENRESFKYDIHNMRDKFKIGGEFKWRKVTPSKINFYLTLIKWFFDRKLELRFRCILVDTDRVDLKRYHGSDPELGFYKFYYHMLYNWIADKTYNIFCDYKENRVNSRLHTLNECLTNKSKISHTINVQSIRAADSVLIQLSDVLTSAVSAKVNNKLNEGTAKTGLVKYIENIIDKEIGPTSRSELKFNIFKIYLRA
mgnify:CR=1 FL=1